MPRSLSAHIEVGLQEAGHSRCEAVGAHVECARAGVEALGSVAIGVGREVDRPGLIDVLLEVVVRALSSALYGCIRGRLDVAGWRRAQRGCSCDGDTTYSV